MNTTAQRRKNPSSHRDPALFYATPLKRQIIRELADYECLPVIDLSLHIYGDTKPFHQHAIRRALKRLTSDVNRVEHATAPNATRQKPYVFGLSAQGVTYALNKFAETDPIEFSKDRSPLLLDHDVDRARIHYSIEQLCKRNHWELTWKRGKNGGNPVPDDYFVIKNLSLPDGANKLYFVLEREHENKKGGFKDIHEKAEQYNRVWNKEEAARRFGAPKFYIIFVFDNPVKMRNAVEFLAGECHCTYWHGKIHHTCLKEPLRQSKFWFTTDEQILSNPDGDIFITPKDYNQATRSFETAFRA